MDLDGERNQRRYRALLDEQFRISYISQGAFNFFEVSCLTTEDRIALVEIIKNIKEEEAQQLRQARESQSVPKPAMSRAPQRFSSRSPQIPRIPKR